MTDNWNPGYMYGSYSTTDRPIPTGAGLLEQVSNKHTYKKLTKNKLKKIFKDLTKGEEKPLFED